MAIPSNELNVHINQIIHYLNSEKKITPQQRAYLKSIMTDLTESGVMSEESMKWYQSLTEIEKSFWLKSITIYSRLLHNINTLAKWLHTNPKTTLPLNDLNRYKNILERVEKMEVFTSDEIENIVAKSHPIDDDER